VKEGALTEKSGEPTTSSVKRVGEGMTQFSLQLFIAPGGQENINGPVIKNLRVFPGFLSGVVIRGHAEGSVRKKNRGFERRGKKKKAFPQRQPNNTFKSDCRCLVGCRL